MPEHREHPAPANIALDVLLAYVICTLCVFVHLILQEHYCARYFLPVCAPSILYFMGREMHAGLPWRNVIAPVCATIGYLGLFMLVRVASRRRVADVPCASTVQVDMVALRVHRSCSIPLCRMCR